MVSEIFDDTHWRPVKGFEFQDISYHRALEQGTVRIGFSRPECRNAFRPQTVDELYTALDHARQWSDVGVVLLTGNGPSDKDGGWAFCSGGDQRIRGKDGYKYEGIEGVDPSKLGRLHILEVQRLIRMMPKVVIAVVPGWAVGGGHSLHVVCDLTLASEEHAIFKQTDADVASFDAGYGSAYLARMAAVLDADKAADGASRGFKLTAETGRYLALWMSFEDIIRVADLKSRPERMARVRKEVGAKDNEPVVVTEYLKPGFEEFASVMPPALGRAVMKWRDQKEWRRDFHFAMRVKTNSFFGFFRLWMLARMQWWRPRTYRFAEEQASIGAWLDALRDAGARNYDLAVEIAELPRLRKGYSDTHQRGSANYQRIFDTLAAPVDGFAGDGAHQAKALRAAREAALADEEGKALDQLLGQTQIPAQQPREAAE